MASIKKFEGYLSTHEVLNLTHFSRYTLHRYVRDGKFPKPHEVGRRTKMQYYCITEVQTWLKENSEFVAKRVEFSNRNKLTIEFSRADMKEIKEAAQILGCEDNMELFITDAAIYKARRIVEYVNSRHFSPR